MKMMVKLDWQFQGNKILTFWTKMMKLGMWEEVHSCILPTVVGSVHVNYLICILFWLANEKSNIQSSLCAKMILIILAHKEL